MQQVTDKLEDLAELKAQLQSQLEEADYELQDKQLKLAVVPDLKQTISLLQETADKNVVLANQISHVEEQIATITSLNHQLVDANNRNYELCSSIIRSFDNDKVNSEETESDLNPLLMEIKQFIEVCQHKLAETLQKSQGLCEQVEQDRVEHNKLISQTQERTSELEGKYEELEVKLSNKDKEMKHLEEFVYSKEVEFEELERKFDITVQALHDTLQGKQDEIAAREDELNFKSSQMEECAAQHQEEKHEWEERVGQRETKNKLLIDKMNVDEALLEQNEKNMAKKERELEELNSAKGRCI